MYSGHRTGISRQSGSNCVAVQGTVCAQFPASRQELPVDTEQPSLESCLVIPDGPARPESTTKYCEHSARGALVWQQVRLLT